MLHLMGIGYKKEHISIEELKILKNSDEIFLEYYTSFFEDSFEELEKFIGKKITICDRDVIESQIEEKILEPAKTKKISLIILGDPLIATTHTDLLLRAKELKVKTEIYNNVSIGNFIARTGLQFYKFGKITSIPFFSEKFMPRTPYMIFLENQKIGAHTVFLLDLNPSNDIAYKGHEKYLKSHNALQFLKNIPQLMLENEEIKKEDIIEITDETEAIICSRLGFTDGKIISGKISDLIEYDKKEDLKEPICLIIPGKMHEMEEKFLDQFKI